MPSFFDGTRVLQIIIVGTLNMIRSPMIKYDITFLLIKSNPINA